MTLFSIFLPIAIATIFFFEGLGMESGREVSYFLSLTFSFFFVILLFFKNKEISVPKQISTLFLLFFLSAGSTTFFSLNIENTFQYLLFYISLYFFFLLGFNFPTDKLTNIFALIFFLGTLFCLYSLLITLTVSNNILFFVPRSGFNFVYPTIQAHNHLGDFIVLPLIGAVSFMAHKKTSFAGLILLFLFLPFLIFSYSRSAYLSFVTVSIVWYVQQLRFHKKIAFARLLLTVTVVVATFIFMAPNISIHMPGLSSLRGLLVDEDALRNKTFFADRPEYFAQAVKSITEKPITGVGLDNFVLAANKYRSDINNWSTSSHNIFLDMFTEGGVVSGLLFLLIIALILIRSKKNLYFLFFLALLINFQTDYTHRFYSLSLLFFFVAGIIYREKELFTKKTVKPIIVVLSILIFAAVQCVVLGKILEKRHEFETSLLFNPFNKNIYPKLIDKKFMQGDIKSGFKFLHTYERLFRGETSVLVYAGEKYLSHDNPDQALQRWKEAFDINPFEERFLVKKIYTLEKIVHGNIQARVFIDNFFEGLKKDKGKISNLGYSVYEIEMLCWEVYKRCPYDFE